MEEDSIVGRAGVGRLNHRYGIHQWQGKLGGPAVGYDGAHCPVIGRSHYSLGVMNFGQDEELKQ